MPALRLSMRQIRELFRLKFGSLLPTSDRQIAAHLGVARSTVAEYLERARAAGLSWPLPLDLSDADLEERLFARPNIRPGARRRPEPDWAAVHRELKRPGVTLMILWEEYRAAQSDGYAYSRFCELYREFETRLAPSMRQTHLAGDKVFVDYSGKTLPIRDPVTGAVRPAQLFIAVLGASNYTYAEATWTQTLPDWIGSHVRMLEAFQGCPRLIVPDNLKSGVLKASFYDPELNRTYAHMAQAYGVGILPARPRRPRDKAKVEAGVRVAQYFILGRLRNLPFFSLAEANGAIGRALEDLNTRPQRRLGLSRQELFEQLDRPALRPLPETPYEFAEWKLVRVGPDYHVEVAGFYYSVPATLIRQQIDARLTATTVEFFHRGQRIAAHARRHGGERHSTVAEHMPAAHRRYAEWSPERFEREAGELGPNTAALIRAILASRPHPEQGFRTCRGVLKLFRGPNRARAEAVSARALEIGAYTADSIASILRNNLDRVRPAARPETPTLEHANIRGPRYFH